MYKILVLSAIVAILGHVESHHLVSGNIFNRVTLAHHETAEYNAIPFVKRVKYFFYSSPDQKIIEGIQALDMLHSKATANITAGGVGYPFVNIRMKSERGRGLQYDMGIYVKQNIY